MKRIPAAILAMLALSGAVLAGAPAASAASDDPRVHVKADAVVQENGFAVFSVEYRCPPRHDRDPRGAADAGWNIRRPRLAVRSRP